MSQNQEPRKNLSLRSLSVTSLSQLNVEAVSDQPLFPLNYKEMWSIILKIMRSGLLNTSTVITNFLTPLICLIFVGRYGVPAELAGASLGNAISNAVSVAVFSSINEGFGIITSQLFATKNYRLVGIVYQRNLCILGIIAVFSMLIMYFMDNFLLAVGLNHDVSINAGIYLKHVIPSIIGLNIFDCTRFYLIGQGVFQVQGAIQFCTSILHVFWCILFVDHLGLSVKGAALAKSITDISSAVFLVVYSKYSKKTKNCSVPWTKEGFINLEGHLRETVRIGGTVYLELMSLEVSTFIVAGLNNPYIIAASGAIFPLVNMLFSIPLGNSVAMQTLIGTALGEGYAYKAKKFIVSGLILGLLYALINVTIFLTLNWHIANLFTEDLIIIDIMRNILLIYCIVHLLDVLSNHLSGVVRTVGKGKEFAINFLVCYVLVGLNFQWIFGIALGYGYVGVWSSVALGIFLMLILMARKVILLDWGNIIFEVAKPSPSGTERDQEESNQLLTIGYRD